MNKTIRTIAIVFLILGALALIGGTLFRWAGKSVAARDMFLRNWQNLPQPGSGWESRGLREGILPFPHRGFYSLPFWLMGSGLTFLIAGAILMIFNKKIMNAIDGTPQKAEKIITSRKSAAQSKKTAGNKPTGEA